jgi:hypothetical protein
MDTVPEQILRLFPLEGVLPDAPKEENEEARIHRIMHVQEHMKKMRDPVSEEAGEYYARIERPGEFYQHYRTVEDLYEPENIDGPGRARAFHEKAGK